MDIKSYIEYLKEFKYRTIETANPISIKEGVENLILPRVMEVLISKVIASLSRACMIYLSEASSSISEDVGDSCSDEQYIIHESNISNNSDETVFGIIRPGEEESLYLVKDFI